MGTPARSFQAATTKGKALARNGYLFLMVRNDKEQDIPMEEDSRAGCEGLAWEGHIPGMPTSRSYTHHTSHCLMASLFP